jgi:hypothetical protein
VVNIFFYKVKRSNFFPGIHSDGESEVLAIQNLRGSAIPVSTFHEEDSGRNFEIWEHL